jgi:hypothetical protein
MALPLPETSAALPETLATAPNQIVWQYTAAEQALVTQSAAIVNQYLRSAQTPVDATRMYNALQQIAWGVVSDLTRTVGPLVETAVMKAARNGSGTAVSEVRKAITGNRALMAVYTKPLGPGVTAHGLHSANLIGQDLKSRLNATNQRITRFPVDVYQKMVAPAAISQVTGGTPQKAQEQAWKDLTSNGVDGFTDAKGREWNLSSCVEMATRTGVSRAFNASHLDRMQSLGIEYYTVAPTGHPCELCLPWEGKVLTVGNPTGPSLLPNAGGEGEVSVHVDATVDEAVAAGLQHPNCKHTLVAFFPGVTVLRTRTQDEIQQGLAEYKQVQYLRGLERAVRQAKMQEAAALNDMDAAMARHRIRDLQARIRDFTAQTGLLRRPRREQLNLGNK